MEFALGISALAFLSIFIFFYGVDRVLNAQRENIESRLDRYATRVVAQAENADLQSDGRGLFGGLNKRLKASGGSDKLILDLGRADIKLTPSEFIAINILSVILGFALFLFLGRGNFAFALIGGVLGFYGPRLYLRQMIARRLKAFQSMETVSRDLQPPVAVEFSRVVREIGLGLSIEEALQHMLDRVQSDDLDLVVTAINIQHEVGGNLSELLDTMSHTIRERVRIKGQIQAMTATQRLSGNVVALLPIGLGLFMYVVNPGYLQSMWQEACGIVMLIFGMVSIATGYFAIRKITDIEV
jgi:tight adherence protein B